MTISTAQAIDAFAKPSIDKSTVKDLKAFFKKTVFKVAVGGTAVGVKPYVVEAPAGQNGLRFNPNAQGKVTVKGVSAAISALVLPVTPEADLLAATPGATKTIFPNPPAAKGWVSLSVADRDAPFVATTQLSGCTLCLGWDKTNGVLYMGHAQPGGGRKGEDLAKDLKGKASFEGVTAELDLRVYGADSHGYRKGSSAKNYYANVLGIVSGLSVFFIRQVYDPAHDKVMSVDYLEFIKKH